MDKLLKKGLRVFNIVLPVLAALLLGAIAIRADGADPIRVYRSILQSAFFNLKGLSSTLVYATPLIMTGLCLVIAFRGGVFNMGGEGQLYMGAFFATVLGFSVTGLPPWLHTTLCLLCGAVCGALWALIPALLKAYLHINELVTTIMLNYVAITICNFLTNGPFCYSYQYTSTQPVAPSAELPLLFPGYTLTAGIFIALAVGVFVWILMNRTTFGYKVDTIGYRQEFAEAVGMNVRKRTMQIFLLSGAIAGLAGATVILSVYHRFTPSFSANPGLGWDGMTAVMLGGSSPVGTVVAAVMLGAFKFGSVSLQVKFGIPTEVIQIVQSSLMLFLSIRFIRENSETVQRLLAKASTRTGKKKKEGA